MIWAILGLALVESLALKAEIVLSARGYAGAASILAAFNAFLWFVIVKIAVEVSWELLPAYAVVFGCGSYIAIRVTRRWRMLQPE